MSKTATPELRLNIFGGDIGGPAFIPGLYPKSRSKTFSFYSEEWRRLIQGATPTANNAIPGYDIPTTGKDLTYVVPPGFKESPNAGICNTGQTAPCVPNTADPAKLALYTKDGLTIGNWAAKQPIGLTSWPRPADRRHKRSGSIPLPFLLRPLPGRAAETMASARRQERRGGARAVQLEHEPVQVVPTD